VLADAKALILTRAEDIHASVPLALRHGTLPVIFCDFKEVPGVGRSVDDLGLRDAKRFVLIASDLTEAIRRIGRADDAPVWTSQLEIHGGDDLDEEERLLLSRAFGDCSRVQLLPELGSGGVFQAYARLTDSKAGPVAMPFFVKFGRRADVSRELKNYRECTTLHVPFNQRPNVDAGRCALGFKSGIIVGNFVERSESLQSVVDRGAALPALQSLFNSALRGWRQQAHIENAKRSTVLAKEMRLCLPSNCNPRRQERLAQHAKIAVSEFGAATDFPELERRLLRLPPIIFLFAIAHNDLHGENVRVIGQEAILIDFSWTDHSPLSADPASLDVSLVLQTESVSDSDWHELAQQLYRIDALTRPPPPLAPEKRGAPIADAVRFIRQVALPDTLHPLEYAIAVAVQLLRKATYGHDDRRRARAYALAEKLIGDIEIAFKS
jgi:hypothetical protein